jgi:carboxymethylenebutenolidase
MTEESFFASGGDQIRMLKTSPSATGPHPALILIPDVRGIYDHFIDVAERFAREGYVVATIDLYTREGPPEIGDVKAALDWMANLSDRRVLADIDACRQALAASDDVRGDAIGITGFCMGGQYALMSACTAKGLAACVSWYGMLRHAKRTQHKLADPLDTAADLACPYLGFFGGTDALIPSDQVAELNRALQPLSVSTEVVSYPEAGHAFFNDSRPDVYVASAAEDAWPRTLEFFRRHLA